MKTVSIKPQGVCSREMIIDYEDDVVVDAHVIGGCPGNLQGICALIKGRKIDDIVKALEGIRCREKPTSCPDQLAKGLKALKNQ